MAKIKIGERYVLTDQYAKVRPGDVLRAVEGTVLLHEGMIVVVDRVVGEKIYVHEANHAVEKFGGSYPERFFEFVYPVGRIQLVDSPE